jgi:hypothetical protein
VFVYGFYNFTNVDIWVWHCVHVFVCRFGIPYKCFYMGFALFTCVLYMGLTLFTVLVCTFDIVCVFIYGFGILYNCLYMGSTLFTCV